MPIKPPLPYRPKALSTVRIPSTAYSPALAEQRQQERAQARLVGGPTFIRDTREQRGWTFDGARCETGTLKTGDYSVKGLEETVAIERKSHADMYGTLNAVRRRARFAAELERASHFKFFALVIEVDLTSFRQPPPKPRTKRLEYDRNATWTHLERMCVKYNVAPWWCSGRVQAQAVAERLLRCAYLEHWREIKHENQQEK